LTALYIYQIISVVKKSARIGEPFMRPPADNSSRAVIKTMHKILSIVEHDFHAEQNLIMKRYEKDRFGGGADSTAVRIDLG
jgi:hypothetical protein